MKLKHHFFYIIFLFFLFFFGNLNHSIYAQENQHADSLLEIINEKSSSLSEKEKGELYFKLASVYYHHEKYSLAIKYQKTALDIFRNTNDKSFEIESLEQLGIYYSIVSDFEGSLKYFLDALQLTEKTKNHIKAHSLILNIGTTYLETNNTEKGLPYLIKAKKFYEEHREIKPDYLFATYVNLGVAYTKLNKSDSALIILRQSLDFCQKNKLEQKIGDVLINIGDIYESKSILDSSLHYYMLAESNFLNINNMRGYWRSVLGEADIRMKIGEFDKAEALFNKASQYFKSINDLLYLSSSYASLSKISEGKGDYKASLEYYKLQIHYRDSAVNSDVLNRMSELQTQFEIQKLEQENRNKIEILEKNKQISTYRWYVFSGLLIIAFLIVSALLYRHKTRKKLTEAKLENIRLEQQQLKNELDFKNKELENFALHIVQKNDFLESVKSRLNELKPSNDNEINIQKIKELKIQIGQSLKLNKELEKFQEKVEKVHSTFLFKLSKEYPELTEKEKRLCVLLKLNLSSKEIAVLNDISEGAVTMARYRLRKKINITSDESLNEVLQKLD